MDRYSLTVFTKNNDRSHEEYFSDVLSVNIDVNGFFDIHLKNGDIKSIRTDSIYRYELINMSPR